MDAVLLSLNHTTGVVFSWNYSLHTVPPRVSDDQKKSRPSEFAGNLKALAERSERCQSCNLEEEYITWWVAAWAFRPEDFAAFQRLWWFPHSNSLWFRMAVKIFAVGTGANAIQGLPD